MPVLVPGPVLCPGFGLCLRLCLCLGLGLGLGLCLCLCLGLCLSLDLCLCLCLGRGLRLFFGGPVPMIVAGTEAVPGRVPGPGLWAVPGGRPWA